MVGGIALNKQQYFYLSEDGKLFSLEDIYHYIERESKDIKCEEHGISIYVELSESLYRDLQFEKFTRQKVIESSFVHEGTLSELYEGGFSPKIGEALVYVSENEPKKYFYQFSKCDKTYFKRVKVKEIISDDEYKKSKCICESLEKGKEIQLDRYNDEQAALKMSKEKGKYYLIADGYDMVDREINYCPFCGRKLAKED